VTQEVAVGVAAETNEVTNLLGSWINGTSTRPVPRAIFLSGFPYDGVTVATNGNSNIPNWQFLIRLNILPSYCLCQLEWAGV